MKKSLKILFLPSKIGTILKLFKLFPAILSISVETIFLSNLQGQNNNLRFNHLTTDDGLSQIRISCILQDSRGFIWIGTQDGLNKYDGHGFTIYNNDPLDTNSLSDNFIQVITEDAEGILRTQTFFRGRGTELL